MVRKIQTIKDEYLDRLDEFKSLIDTPDWLFDSSILTFIGGSHSYGFADSASDVDIYHVVVPPKEMVYYKERYEIIGIAET